MVVTQNFWAIPKLYTGKYPHLDDAALETLIREVWAQVAQDFINRKVEQIPERPQAVRDSEGTLAGY